MSKTGVIRIDDTVKKNAEIVLEEMGMSASTAVEIFFRQLSRSRKFPFVIQADKEPNKMTMAAIEDAENNRNMHKYDSVEDLMRDLNAWNLSN